MDVFLDVSFSTSTCVFIRLPSPPPPAVDEGGRERGRERPVECLRALASPLLLLLREKIRATSPLRPPHGVLSASSVFFLRLCFSLLPMPPTRQRRRAEDVISR